MREETGELGLSIKVHSQCEILCKEWQPKGIRALALLDRTLTQPECMDLSTSTKLLSDTR